MAIPTEPCDPAGPSATDAVRAVQLNPELSAKMAGYLDAYRMSCARMVTQAVKERGLNPRAAAIAIATIIVETSRNNYSRAVDHTSLGLFQQQDWWGGREQRLNPAHATGGTEVTAAANADGRIEVFGTNNTGTFHRGQTGFATWSAWAWLNSTPGPTHK